MSNRSIVFCEFMYSSANGMKLQRIYNIRYESDLASSERMAMAHTHNFVDSNGDDDTIFSLYLHDIRVLELISVSVILNLICLDTEWWSENASLKLRIELEYSNIRTVYFIHNWNIGSTSQN